MHGSFVINVDNRSELTGDADYVFVGKVISMNDTIYKDPVAGEDERGKPIELASPYTNYTVNVLKNIKGELVTDKDIPIQKSGGIAEDQSQYFLYEKDQLPVEGNVYIFYSYAQPDGSLLVSGPNSNRKIDSLEKNLNSSSDIEETEEYKEAVEGYKTQVVRDRERNTSSYDANRK